MNKYKIYLKKIKKYRSDINFFSQTKFSNRKQTFFAKRMSFLIKSEVPIVESISLIRDQTKSKSEIKIFNKIIADIKNGKSLAASLAGHGIFGNFAVNIIRAGESSGTLTENLNYLADELKKKEILRRKILGALLYPLIVTIATLLITGFLVMYIFPKIIPIFESLKAKLPLSTRIIIFITNALKHDGLYILIGIIALIIIYLIVYKNVPKVRFFMHGLTLRLPITGGIAKNYNLTNACRTLGLLLLGGIPITEALLITADTTENLQYKKAFEDISSGVKRGKNISELLFLSPLLFPDMLGQMVAVGEKSGNLSNTLIYLSEFYENEFEDLTKNLSSTIEPVLMVVMGIIVGFVAISVITPIYEITNNIKR